jgi:hypothetical protein
MGLLATILGPLLMVAMVPATDQVQPATTTEYDSIMVATVDVPCTALRAEPSPRHPVVDFLYEGNQVTVIEVAGEWLQVRTQADPEVTGWMHRIQTEVGYEDILAQSADASTAMVAAPE